MVFSSLVFLYLFLPLNLLCYALAKNIRQKNIVMTVSSLVFYAWGNPVYLLLLVGMAFGTWGITLQIWRGNHSQGKAKLWVAAACVLDLGLLFVFKYATFFFENTHNLFGTPEIVPQILLPIGISFYTFQLISYVVDVYRKEVAAQKQFSTLLLYVSLFHQCIAGPIVRYRDIEAELLNRKADLLDIYAGITRFTVGLAKKSLLANTCGNIADTLLLTDAVSAAENGAAVMAQIPALSLWLGMFAYMLEIYLDFSAYSDMAIGMGLMLGFHYKENFNYPYTAKSVTDFWHRWHISLSQFFRDYVYIPLGGNRRSKPRVVLNLLVVWALTGFWHGASWNYLLWGLYYFVFAILERTLLKNWLAKSHPVLHRVYLLLVVYFGWVLFKFESLSLVGTTLKGMFGLNGNGFTDFETNTTFLSYLVFFVVAIIAVTPFVHKLRQAFDNTAYRGGVLYGVYAAVRTVCPVVLLVLSTAALVGNSYNPFLYFQF